MQKMNTRIIRILLAVLLGSSIFSSCGKHLLEVPPNNSLSSSNFWKTESDALTGVNAVYNALWGSSTWGYIDLWGGCMWWIDDITDDGFWVANGMTTEQDGWGGIANATETPLGDGSYASRTWTGCWNMIALANNALYEIPQIPFTAADSALKSRYLAECKVLRAMAYHHLVVHWGGVPLLTLPVSVSGINEPFRSTYDSCVAQMDKDLTEAIPELPTGYTGQDVGRTTKGFAMTLLTQQYLFDKKYQEASDYAQQIMNLNVYQLLPSFSSVWQYGNKNTKESIFEVQFGDAQGGSMPPWIDGWYPSGTEYGHNGWGGHATPQQQFVNEFESVTYDGSGHITSTSTFDPGTIRYLFDTLQYKNRDPRLYATVWYNGADYFGQPYDPNFYSASSGYHWRKYNTAPQAALRDGLPDYNYIIFRYSYVLLAYAEAKNELSGPDVSIYSAVNQVRERAGMPDLAGGLSQADMRTAIRHEKRVEMGGEGQRYEDLIRWGLFQQAIANRGVNNGRQQGNTIIPDFRLLWPIPAPEIDANPNMKQNPGY